MAELWVFGGKGKREGRSVGMGSAELSRAHEETGRQKRVNCAPGPMITELSSLSKKGLSRYRVSATDAKSIKYEAASLPAIFILLYNILVQRLAMCYTE
jgi:hypothetical protein